MKPATEIKLVNLKNPYKKKSEKKENANDNEDGGRLEYFDKKRKDMSAVSFCIKDSTTVTQLNLSRKIKKIWKKTTNSFRPHTTYKSTK